MNITLTRFAYLEQCTLGWLLCGSLRLATIERPWIPCLLGPGGKDRESCVPDGDYTVFPHSSSRFPNVYALVNERNGVYYQTRPVGQAWGRTAILIHSGNFVTDVVGCIAVGLNHGGNCVVSSREALDKLRVALQRDKHSIVIRPASTSLEIAA